MKICALTMVYKDYWALSVWYTHHAKILGADALYIVVHGADEKIQHMCPGASVITIPRDDLSHFDRRRGQMLNAFQTGLLASYDWVIRTDADELICADPSIGSLPEILRDAKDVPVVTALGLDLVEQPDDTGMTGRVFACRKNASFSGHYSKAFALSRPENLSLHGTKIRPKNVANFPFYLPEGLYLVHLKYANLKALPEVNATRMAVSAGDENGLPGAGWRAADEDAAKFLDSFSAKPVLPWAKARAKAYRALAVEPARSDRLGIVKAKALKFSFRTVLPDWFVSI